MTDDQSLQRLTPDELLGDPAGTEPTGPVEKRARDMATGVALKIKTRANFCFNTNIEILYYHLSFGPYL